MEEEFKNDTNYLDQHFLVDKSIINAFIDASNLRITEDVIEIGPGKGSITKLLKSFNSFLIAYELDTDLKEYLDNLVDKKTTVFYKDILKANIKEDVKDILNKHMENGILRLPKNSGMFICMK